MHANRRTFLLSTLSCLGAEAMAQAQQRALKWQPKLSENLADVQPETLRWRSQLGCQYVIFQGADGIDPDNKGYWTAAGRRHERTRQRSCFPAILGI